MNLAPVSQTAYDVPIIIAVNTSKSMIINRHGRSPLQELICVKDYRRRFEKMLEMTLSSMW